MLLQTRFRQLMLKYKDIDGSFKYVLDANDRRKVSAELYVFDANDNHKVRAELYVLDANDKHRVSAELYVSQIPNNITSTFE